MTVERSHTIAVIGFMVLGILGLIAVTVSFMLPAEKTYTIHSEHAVYHTDSFRIYGRGIVFDADNERVIVMGNFEIKKNLAPN